MCIRVRLVAKFHNKGQEVFVVVLALLPSFTSFFLSLLLSFSLYPYTAFWSPSFFLFFLLARGGPILTHYPVSHLTPTLFLTTGSLISKYSFRRNPGLTAFKRR